MRREEALKVKVGDFVRIKPLWNKTESRRKLPKESKVFYVFYVEHAQSQTGVLFKVQFLNGDFAYLDAGWFE